MRVLLIGAALLAVSPAVAFAQDAMPSWSGAYVGGTLSGNKLSHHSDTLTFDTNLDGTYGDTVNTYGHMNAFAPGFCQGSPSGATMADGCRKTDSKTGIGVRAGYDWQTDAWVYGVVGDITGVKLNDSVTGFTATDSYTFTRKVKSLSALRGRVGYAMSDWLVYATAGVAWADMDKTFTTTNASNSFSASGGKNKAGSQVGLGLEKAIDPQWRVGIEYLHTSVDDKSSTVRASQGGALITNDFVVANPNGTDIRRSGDRLQLNSLMVTVSYKFM